MNEEQELIFQQALQSDNPQAVANIAQIFYGIGEEGRGNALVEHIRMLGIGFGVNIPQVPIPLGYRRAKPKEITKPVLKFANVALKGCLPIGKQRVATVTDPGKSKRVVMALTEVHYDNHPPRPKQGFKGYEGPKFLHPGISILVPNLESNPTVTPNPSSNWLQNKYQTYSNR